MSEPLRCPGMLPREEYLALRCRVIFECGKWDPQCGDVEVLAPYPLLLEPDTWDWLARAAEQLARETVSAELEILARPELHRSLGLPGPILRALRGASPNRESPRCIRFDFHATEDGWRISEANTDVPGGFIEAAGFTRAMAERFGEGAPAGDPAAALVDALLRRVRAGSQTALVHATAYSDDRQVMVSLAHRLTQRGAAAHLVAPDRIAWNSGRPRLDTGEPLDALIRFYPAEWLPNLPRGTAWPSFFRSAALQVNPPAALLTQSKRFPLVWNRLRTPMDAWRTLLPETRDPRRAPPGEDWVLKPALGRVGDGIALRSVTDERERRGIARAAKRQPMWWAAQRRFGALPVHTSQGPRFPCLGVFVIDGRAAGIYGRIAERPLIDARAQDVAVLVAAPRASHACSGERHGRAPAAV